MTDTLRRVHEEHTGAGAWAGRGNEKQAPRPVFPGAAQPAAGADLATHCPLPRAGERGSFAERVAISAAAGGDGGGGDSGSEGEWGGEGGGSEDGGSSEGGEADCADSALTLEALEALAAAEGDLNLEDLPAEDRRRFLRLAAGGGLRRAPGPNLPAIISRAD